MSVLMRVEPPRLLAVRAGRDHRGDALIRDGLNQFIGVVRFVRHHSLSRKVFNQCLRFGSDREPDRQSASSAPVFPSLRPTRMDLAGQPTPRAAERLITRFFWAPAAYGWARTIVESRNTSSKSAFLTSSANTRYHTLVLNQRAKRWYTLFQLPNAVGRSRYGHPQHGLDKQPVIFPVPSAIALLPGQHAFDSFPLVITQYLSHYRPNSLQQDISWNSSLDQMSTDPRSKETLPQ